MVIHAELVELARRPGFTWGVPIEDFIPQLHFKQLVKEQLNAIEDISQREIPGRAEHLSLLARD